MKIEVLSKQPELPVIEECMTNFDGSIDEGMDDKLRKGECISEHCAWNFHGDVWFQDGKFREQVWQYHEPVAEFEADTLEELMQEVNEEFGSD